jgi:hypothetical protein
VIQKFLHLIVANRKDAVTGVKKPFTPSAVVIKLRCNSLTAFIGSSSSD